MKSWSEHSKFKEKQWVEYGSLGNPTWEGSWCCWNNPAVSRSLVCQIWFKTARKISRHCQHIIKRGNKI